LAPISICLMSLQTNLKKDRRKSATRRTQKKETAAEDLSLAQFRRSSWWTVYKLSPRDEHKHTSSSSSDSIDPEQLEQRLREEISLFMKGNLCVQMHQDVIWIRIVLDESEHSRDAVYLAYYPRSRAIFASSIKLSLRDIVFHAVETALNCDIEKTKLRSRNLQALVDMVLNQDSQGTFRDYRVDNPPLTGTAVVESQSSVSSLPPLPVVVEDAEMQNQTQQHLIDTFGSSTMPALDRIDLRVVDSFRGGYELGSTFECTVRFEGSNVLEGIRNLVQLGIAQPPLPDYLANLPSLCQNSFNIVNPMPERKDKEKEENSQETSLTSVTTTLQTEQTEEHEETGVGRRKGKPQPNSRREEYGIVQMGQKRRGV